MTFQQLASEIMASPSIQQQPACVQTKDGQLLGEIAGTKLFPGGYDRGGKKHPDYLMLVTDQPMPPVKCPVCHGTGEIRIGDGSTFESCTVCNGTGKIGGQSSNRDVPLTEKGNDVR